MAWSTSNRKRFFPGNWAALRRKVLDRAGGRCQHVDPDTGVRCRAAATQVDHILSKVDSADGGYDDSLSNLQALCSYHHSLKSSSEGGRAHGRNVRKEREREWYSHPAFQ